MPLLFSYGSNHPTQMAERLGHDVETVGAFATGYVRVFQGYSQRWQGGVASLKKEKEGVVFGLVATVTKEDLLRMDMFEGVASGHYQRIMLTVNTQADEKKKVIAYVSTSTDPAQPSRDYLEAVAKTIGVHWRGSKGAKIEWRDITVR